MTFSRGTLGKIVFLRWEDSIEHSENKIITQSGLFENEIGAGVLQSSVQQTGVLQEYQRHKPCATDYMSFPSLFYELFTNCMFVNAGLDYSRSNLVFETDNDFIFGMLY